MNLFENIKTLCETRNITITALERALDFSVASISKWKDGNPSLLKVMQVAQYFNVTLDFLVNSSFHIQQDIDEIFLQKLLLQTRTGKVKWERINYEDDSFIGYECKVLESEIKCFCESPEYGDSIEYGLTFRIDDNVMRIAKSEYAKEIFITLHNVKLKDDVIRDFMNSFIRGDIA